MTSLPSRPCDSPEDEWDHVYNEPDADETLVIYMTRRQWMHLDDWRAEHPDRYPNRAHERQGAWLAIENAERTGH